ncbi:GNAT family N-acetyltransferase [Sandaracinus amylolyticus]|uniref:GNAT family N-acetyltransferase n=1 Tax=Sandaracinus amylolyticus TaxID=927083 RepID=UPI001F006994|nr:GNAT family N-acetyltransferase [Sandaracinus amylolyticus]UJR78703.1 N-acetyltransferase domain-containing protein [Sandaracinus amylolyticus]
MDIRATFYECESLAEVSRLREEYLDELPEAQDALLEARVSAGRCHAIRVGGALCGYFVVDDDDTLLELHLTAETSRLAIFLLPRIVAEHGIRAALVKTFDHVLLAPALDLAREVRVLGVLVREFEASDVPDGERVPYTQRPACMDDLPRIRAIEQDVFTHPERLRRVIELQQLQLFEHDGLLIGFGIVRPVIPYRPQVEIGIAVDVPFRSKGYAVQLLRDMAQDCRARGLEPICGCARSNEASIRTGFRAGFSSRHRLIEVRFGL